MTMDNVAITKAMDAKPFPTGESLPENTPFTVDMTMTTPSGGNLKRMRGLNDSTSVKTS